MIRVDPAKRLRSLQQRRLDFLDAERVFDGRTLEFQDVRRDLGEEPIVCLGLLQGRIVSMRKANAREQRHFRSYVT